jgi:hypothetical protein
LEEGTPSTEGVNLISDNQQRSIGDEACRCLGILDSAKVKGGGDMTIME